MVSSSPNSFHPQHSCNGFWGLFIAFLQEQSRKIETNKGDQFLYEIPALSVVG